ncbi:MAG: hypothetical protein M3Z24_05150 [Chloroflexota bacterium]|nr:hypothetical protein [Chloroflexota bacterium]
MAKDRLEHKSYRKSPGRQYDNNYDPLRSQYSGFGTSGADEMPTYRANRTSGTLAQRPDPRRTRQLLRKNILASKSRSAVLDDEQELEQDVPTYQEIVEEENYPETEEQDERAFYGGRYPISSGRAEQLYAAPVQHYPETGQEDYEIEADEWDGDAEYLDPDIGQEEEDSLDHRGYADTTLVQPPAYTSRRLSERRTPSREEEEYEYEEEVPRRRRAKKKGLVSRRKLLLGAVGVAAAGVAAYELEQQMPKLLNEAGTNIEHQLQDAYNNGANAVRKELINSLDNLEGVSLDGAMAAARLTRVAYDVFVQPVVTLAATVTGDFLSVTLRTFITARGWLARIYQDNATLGAIQTVLESWVKQVNGMPKQLQSITDTDLDGAQAYLRSLKTKIQQEQAKLNGTSSPTPTPKSTGTPKH